MPGTSSAVASTSSGSCVPFGAHCQWTIAIVFIASWVNYRNGAMYGMLAQVIHQLQMVLNAAARLVVGAGKFQHNTPVLRDVNSLAASAPADPLQDGHNCFWLCPRHRPSLLQGHLCAGRLHLWAGTPPFGWTLWHAGASDQDLVRPMELPCCSPRRLELAAYTPVLNLRQSWTVQRWVEDPSLHTDVLRLPLRTFV